jgi:hypothetical protein
MKDLQKTGGIASLIEAVTVVVGLGMFATLLTDYTTGDPSAAESVAYVADNQAILYIWNTITLIVFAVFLVVVSLALYDRLKDAGAITRAATVFGFIWSGLLLAGGMVTNIGLGSVADLSASNSANAESVWLALDAVQSGLSGGNEITGGVWILLISWAGIKTGALPRALNYLGIAMGVAALVTIVPALEVVGAVFGLGLIVWFIWLGMIMLRNNTSVPA